MSDYLIDAENHRAGAILPSEHKPIPLHVFKPRAGTFLSVWSVQIMLDKALTQKTSTVLYAKI